LTSIYFSLCNWILWFLNICKLITCEFYFSPDPVKNHHTSLEYKLYEIKDLLSPTVFQFLELYLICRRCSINLLEWMIYLFQYYKVLIYFWIKFKCKGDSTDYLLWLSISENTTVFSHPLHRYPHWISPLKASFIFGGRGVGGDFIGSCLF
jgi:hypothetical protein